jgi:hypothetical protein
VGFDNEKDIPNICKKFSLISETSAPDKYLRHQKKETQIKKKYK